MTRTKRRIDPVSRRRLIVVGVALLAMIGFVLWRMAGTEVISSYLRATDKVIARANISTLSFNEQVAQFYGDSESAEASVDAFAGLADAFAATRTELMEIEPPEPAREYHASLLLVYEEYETWSRDMAEVADHIALRGDLLDQLSTAVATFNEQVTQAQSDEQIMQASEALNGEVEQVIAELDAMPTPELLMYASDTLSSNLEDMAAASQLMADATRTGDPEAAVAGAEALGAVLERDWGTAMIERDAEGTLRYEDSLNRIRELEQDVQTRRASLGTR